VNERDKVYFEHVKIDYVKSLFGGGQFKVLRVWFLWRINRGDKIWIIIALRIVVTALEE
jgi:hypothetical protein